MNTGLKYYRIQITGIVQGVAFRYYSKKKADALGLRGTTENQKDGSVISYIIGDKNDARLFIEWCHEGSPASDVKTVIYKELASHEDTEYQDFSILR